MSKIVAVYGSLRKGMGNDGLLDGQTFIGLDTLKGYDMVSLGGFPAISKGEGTVVVELWEVDALAAQRLDMLEGTDPDRPIHEDNFYNRHVVTTELGTTCSVYTLESCRYDEGPVESGDWVQYVTGEARAV